MLDVEYNGTKMHEAILRHKTCWYIYHRLLLAEGSTTRTGPGLNSHGPQPRIQMPLELDTPLTDEVQTAFVEFTIP